MCMCTAISKKRNKKRVFRKWNNNERYMVLAYSQKSFFNISIYSNNNYLPGIIDTVLRARSTRNVRKPAKLPTSIPIVA